MAREALIGAGEPFNLPMLADARTSLVLDLTHVCHVERGWSAAAQLEARIIGPRRQAWLPGADYRAEMVGAYLQPGASEALFGMPASEFTDRSAPLEAVWGPRSVDVLTEAVPLDEVARVQLLERLLLNQLKRPVQRGSVDVPPLAAWVLRHPTVTVENVAQLAGVSRRQLARLFERAVGVSPKRFCRLARFKRGLAYAGAGVGVPWAQVASELGYSDQSHFIAECQELAGLTPEGLATRKWFHPFILEAQASAIGAGTRVERAPRSHR